MNSFFFFLIRKTKLSKLKLFYFFGGGGGFGDVPPNLLIFDKKSVSLDDRGLDRFKSALAELSVPLSSGVSNLDLKALMYGVILFFLVFSSGGVHVLSRVCDD